MGYQPGGEIMASLLLVVTHICKNYHINAKYMINAYKTVCHPEKNPFILPRLHNIITIENIIDCPFSNISLPQTKV